MGGLCPGGLCPGKSLSRGASVQEGLCLWGSLSSCPGDLCLGDQKL